MAKPNPSSQAHNIHVPPLEIRADVGTVNEEERTVELTFSVGADVTRFDWWTGKRYIERLSLDPKHVRLGRLNNGAPILDSHSSWSTANVLGVVVDKSASVDGKKGLATARFARDDEDADKAWNKIKQRVLRNVSVGYRVYKFEETQGKENELPVRTATDWEPFEISVVPMGADDGAKMRSVDMSKTNPCVLVTRAAKENAMENESETIIEQNPGDPGAPAGQRAAETRTEQTDAELAATAERQRVQGILTACRAARLPQEFADRLIEAGTALVRAQADVFEEMRKRGADSQGPAVGATVQIVGEDPLVHVRSGIENALLHRVAPHRFELTDVGRKYRGLSMLETAAMYLRARGVRTTSMSKSEIAGMALGLEVRAGMHTTSDFPLLLADVFNKTLRREYEEAPATYKAIVRMTTAPDFKTINRLQLGDAPALQEVLEHGEFKRGTISEAKEAYALKTWGRMFAITRKALINDDTDAFSRVPQMFGRAARQTEADLVWAQITSNPTMGDNVALFHSTHGNLASTDGAPSVALLSDARAAIRQQTGLDSQKINLVPRFLIVPTALETEAEQLVMPITPGSASEVNPFSGKLTVVAEARLDDDSEAAWYVAASPDQVDIVELCMLEGQNGPMIESRVGFDVDGLEIKCRHDVAAKVLDFRGLFKNQGDT